MKKTTTSVRLKWLMEQRNLKQADILRLCEPYLKEYGMTMSRGSFSQYVSGAVEPGQWKLTILGLALNVSEAWLMGYDVPMEREQPTPAPEQEPERGEIATLFASLSEENQRRLLDFAQVLLVAQQAEHGSQG